MTFLPAPPRKPYGLGAFGSSVTDAESEATKVWALSGTLVVKNEYWSGNRVWVEAEVVSSD